MKILLSTVLVANVVLIGASFGQDPVDILAKAPEVPEPKIIELIGQVDDLSGLHPQLRLGWVIVSDVNSATPNKIRCMVKINDKTKVNLYADLQSRNKIRLIESRDTDHELLIHDWSHNHLILRFEMHGETNDPDLTRYYVFRL